MENQKTGKDAIDEKDLIVICGLCCCASTYYNKCPDCVGCSEKVELLSIVFQFCCKLGTEPLLCNNPPDVICQLGFFICSVGYKIPTTICKCELHHCCLVNTCALPNDNEIPCVIAVSGIMCYPQCGCCKPMPSIIQDHSKVLPGYDNLTTNSSNLDNVKSNYMQTRYAGNQNNNLNNNNYNNNQLLNNHNPNIYNHSDFSSNLSNNNYNNNGIPSNSNGVVVGNNMMQYNNGAIINNGMQYNNGAIMNIGMQYGNGVVVGNNMMQYNNGAINNGLQYNNSVIVENIGMQYGNGVVVGNNMMQYNNGAINNGMQYGNNLIIQNNAW